jgi:hypothetical protein
MIDRGDNDDNENSNSSQSNSFIPTTRTDFIENINRNKKTSDRKMVR